jgi:Rps23 Pro-64 3,4-dihydroxylase Tpa1-like proline 4-hydroxylase
MLALSMLLDSFECKLRIDQCMGYVLIPLNFSVRTRVCYHFHHVNVQHIKVLLRNSIFLSLD